MGRILNDIRLLIESNKFLDACDLLDRYGLIKESTMFRSILRQLESDSIKQIISREDHSVALNRIRDSVLELAIQVEGEIMEMPKDYLVPSDYDPRSLPNRYDSSYLFKSEERGPYELTEDFLTWMMKILARKYENGQVDPVINISKVDEVCWEVGIRQVGDRMKRYILNFNGYGIEVLNGGSQQLYGIIVIGQNMDEKGPSVKVINNGIFPQDPRIVSLTVGRFMSKISDFFTSEN